MERFPSSFGFIRYVPRKVFGKGRKNLQYFWANYLSVTNKETNEICSASWAKSEKRLGPWLAALPRDGERTNYQSQLRLN